MNLKSCLAVNVKHRTTLLFEPKEAIIQFVTFMMPIGNLLQYRVVLKVPKYNSRRGAKKLQSEKGRLESQYWPFTFSIDEEVLEQDALIQVILTASQSQAENMNLILHQVSRLEFVLIC